jgi:hypothetical protein
VARASFGSRCACVSMVTARAERLEAAIARLTDAIEASQPVGDRLKQRQAELDALRVKLAEPEPVDLDREQFEVELAWWVEPLRRAGPLVSERDPIQTRSAMRHPGSREDHCSARA